MGFLKKRLLRERRKFYYLILVPLLVALALSLLVVKEYLAFLR
ncbi:hypothetical protein ACFL5X_02955 [Candidatus Omnitrophota bacterium]